MLTTLATSPGVGRSQLGAGNLRYAFCDRNHHRPEGATPEALICHWRQSSVTGQLECVWGSERIAGGTDREGPYARVQCS